MDVAQQIRRIAPSRAIREVARDALDCQRCPLYRNATQTVFGEGSVAAPLMLVGEQPGDQEDLQGHVFVGPAGRILDRALREANVDRSEVYLTNAVKHFKNEPRGKRRLHRRPNTYEIERCRWWLDHELAIIKPKLILALGATAARALAGRPVSVGQKRNVLTEFVGGYRGLVTIHPSAILRIREQAERHRVSARLAGDIAYACEVATKAAA